MPNHIYDDEYVANLLKQDAKTATKNYELVGMDAFNSKNLKPSAPKPNTNFLRHIIRQTDSHNAALLAREAEESKTRLKKMDRERIRARRHEDSKKRKADGRLTPISSDEEHNIRHRRAHVDRSEEEGGRNSSYRRRERSVESDSRRHRSRDTGMRREKRKRENSVEGRSERQQKRSEHRQDKYHRHTADDIDKSDRTGRTHRPTHTHRRHRSRSESLSRSRAQSPHTSRTNRESNYRERRRPHRRSSQCHNTSSSSRKTSRKHRPHSPAPGSGSDPLEAIVGPLPPHAQPSVRSRGRGAHKVNSMGMDSHFSSTYDPTVDVRPASDAEDDWGETVETFRDRQRWKQQGADRLKAAGFTDDQVLKWEKGDAKNEDDVTWAKQGQAREWDRGKIVDANGDVKLKVEWGRLK
ncbi:hypothetical protein GQ44DRAFT_688902 [Phaeosphaeriaceae sp. PMI808]|nr:hypothetical protein GQ44DRAFT_688902 [Phaeosphaeriaceae sp. PMI808]